MSNRWSTVAVIVLRSMAASALLMCALADVHAQEIATIRVGESWTGANVRYSGVRSGNIAYVGYYDARREMTLARVDILAGSTEKIDFGSQFDGYDSHNEIVVFADGRGLVHVAGNMHRTPLVYGYLRFGEAAASLVRSDRMTGVKEDRVTYPRFYSLPDGSTAFVYRHGISGDGETRVKFFNGASWVDLEQSIFGGEDNGRKSNVYFSDLVRGPDGRFHVAWNWRYRPSDVRNNTDIAYAWTPDLRKWFDADGSELSLPISQRSTAIVERIPVNSGLMNSVALSFDRDSRPLITFLRYDRAGKTQANLARRIGSQWRVAALTQWSDRWDLQGGGTIVQKVTVGPAVVDARGGYGVDLRHFKEGKCYLRLKSDFAPVGCEQRPRSEDSIRWPVGAALPSGFRYRQAFVVAHSEEGAKRPLLRWVVQDAEHSIKPTCTSERPLACRPPPQALELLVPR